MFRWMTPVEVAKLKGVTRQSVILAIKSGRLKATRYGRFWRIFSTDLYDYYNNLYSRKLSRHKGDLIFDKNKSLVSVEEASALTGVPNQKIYYAIRSGKLKGNRVGPNYVISLWDLTQYSSSFLQSNMRKKKSS